MKLKRLPIILFALLVAIVLGVNAMIFLQVFFAQSERPAKIEWSVLQAAEESFRTNVQEHVLLHNMDGHRLVGIKANVDNKRVWIFLNPRASAFKKLGDEDYSINQEELSRIRAVCEINPAALKELISHSEQDKP